MQEDMDEQAMFKKSCWLSEGLGKNGSMRKECFLAMMDVRRKKTTLAWAVEEQSLTTNPDPEIDEIG